MEIIEQFVEGRTGDPGRCEDMLFLSDDFLSVLDGATDEEGDAVEGVPSGLFAARRVAEQMISLPRDATAEEAFRHLSAALGPESPRPQCDAIVFSRARMEVWRVGTLHLLLDRIAYPSNRRIDEVTSSARAAYNQSLLLGGSDPSRIAGEDPGRALILPLLREQRAFSNRADSEWGYGSINGRDIPSIFLEIFPVSPGSEIVFASDGYPRAMPSLGESEEDLRKHLRDDPLRIHHPSGTKGLRPGDISFDDRAYLRFQA